MTIYIESFLIQNILINFCLIKLIHSTTKCKSTFFKMLLASIVGASASIVSIYFIENVPLLNITKLATAILMISIAFKQGKKLFVTNFILLFLYTYSFGGLITSFNSKTYFTTSGMITLNKFSLEIICLLITIFTYIFDLVVKHLKLKIQTNNLIYDITLTHNNKSVTVHAYLDTGNFLNHNGNPVLIVDLNTYLKLTRSNLIDFYLSKSDKLSASTISGNNNLKCFKIDKLNITHKTIKKELNNQIIAINTSNCFKNTNYQALLSPLFL